MSHVERVHQRHGSEVVVELRAMNVEIDRDVMRIGPRTWAIHGSVAYDGEVIAAIFSSEREAWRALSHPSDVEPRPGASLSPVGATPCATGSPWREG